MKPIRTALAAALLAFAPPAHGGATQERPRQDGASEQLISEFQAIATEWEVAEEAYRAAKTAVRNSEAYLAVLASKDRAKAREMIAAVARPDGRAFGARSLALADRWAGDPTLEVLTFAATELGDAVTAKLVIERVLRDHLKSEALGQLLGKSRSYGSLIGAEGTKEFLSKVLASNPHPLPRAHALLTLGQTTLRDRAATAEELARAKAQVEKADGLAQGTPLARRTGRVRFEFEHLIPGCEALDIVGEDLNGVAFKLSDYRGKVVLLDFWGFW